MSLHYYLLQVDLAQEGRHLWQFNYNFRKQPHIRFPYPIYPLVSPEVSDAHCWTDGQNFVLQLACTFVAGPLVVSHTEHQLHLLRAGAGGDI